MIMARPRSDSFKEVPNVKGLVTMKIDYTSYNSLKCNLGLQILLNLNVYLTAEVCAVRVLLVFFNSAWTFGILRTDEYLSVEWN